MCKSGHAAIDAGLNKEEDITRMYMSTNYYHAILDPGNDYMLDMAPQSKMLCGVTAQAQANDHSTLISDTTPGNHEQRRVYPQQCADYREG